MKIPLMKHAFLHEEATKDALAEWIRHAPWLRMGEECAKFERAFAAYTGRRDAVLFNSGGSANLAMLTALLNLGKLQRGDKVAFSALTWSTNPMPIMQLGLEPVPVDVDVRTLNVMSTQLRDVIRTQEIKAFFATNVLGFAGDLDVIRDLCAGEGVLFIEDNCESLGTELAGAKTGTFSSMASHSFFVAHHMSTIEGGMVICDDEEVSEMLRIVRCNGWDRDLTPEQQRRWRERYGIRNEFEARYTFYDLGYNLRPTEITGFLGQRQLAYLPGNVEQRAANFARLEAAMAENPDLLPIAHDHIDVVSSFALPVICRTPALREHYINKFTAAGVETRPLIAGNLQRQPFFSKYVKTPYQLPGADILHACALYAPNFPELTEDELTYLCELVRRRATIGPQLGISA